MALPLVLHIHIFVPVRILLVCPKLIYTADILLGPKFIKFNKNWPLGRVSANPEKEILNGHQLFYTTYACEMMEIFVKSIQLTMWCSWKLANLIKGVAKANQTVGAIRVMQGSVINIASLHS